MKKIIFLELVLIAMFVFILPFSFSLSKPDDYLNVRKEVVFLAIICLFYLTMVMSVTATPVLF
jgi:hypothetical protein